MNDRFDPEEEMRLASFLVGDEIFAIDIMRIREIVRPLPTTPVPRAPFGMIGVFNLRGQVLPLFDLRQRFGIDDEAAKGHDSRFLITMLEGRLIGLLVDKVHEVVTVRRKDLRIAADVLSGDAARFFVAVLNRGEQLVLLLNLHRLLDGAEKIDLSGLSQVNAGLGQGQGQGRDAADAP